MSTDFKWDYDSYWPVVAELKKGGYMDEIKVGKTREHVRSFWALLGLSIVTLSIYYFYWLYVNLKEIREDALSGIDDSVVRRAQTWFWAKIGVLITTTLVSLIIMLPPALADPYHITIPRGFVLIPAISFAVNITFFYFFTVSVSEGQRKVQLASFRVLTIFVFYLISSVIELVGGIVVLREDVMAGLSDVHSWTSLPSLSVISLTLLGFFNTVGNILWLISVYLIQEQINKIWKEGQFLQA